MRKTENFVYQTATLFAFLAVLFVPFSFQNLTIQSHITKFIFEDLILFIAAHFDTVTVTNPEISSDSTTLYVLFFVLLSIALVVITLLSFLKFWKLHQNVIIRIIQLVLTYYLACIMLRYGFDKIFKLQFYLPEPNLLYTPLGMLDKDILFWSTMGTSNTYSVFMGLMEVIPALLLLFHKTRTFGLFILSGVLLNVVFINFGFDISVKLYAIFLLFLCLLLLAPNFKRIVAFFIANQVTPLHRLQGSDWISSKAIRFGLKAIVLLFIFFESFFPYWQKRTYIDDDAIRNPFHGAYEVLKIQEKTQKSNTFNLKVKRIFIHKDNYFIFQYQDDTTEDFHFAVNSAQHQFVLTDYDGKTIVLHYQYSQKSKILELQAPDLGIIIISKSLPWKNLPLLQPLFHWTVDEI